MAGELYKIRPDRDLQCYFQRPSAIAAFSDTSENGFTVSGCWRQQFDWVVIEWNRDNVFEHPAVRNLPDGDLRGLLLSYEEVRENCIPLDSTLYPTVDWPYLRIWAQSAGIEVLYKVPLKNYAVAAGGDYIPATVEFELQGTLVAGDYIELAWLDQHFNYQILGSDSLASAAGALAAVITANQGTSNVSAAVAGTRITLTYHGGPGANGNRIGVYGSVHGSETESWAPAWAGFEGGASPERWRVELDFGNIHDVNNVLVPVTDVRKMRWTWAADLQAANFVRSEFSVVVENWAVTGTNRQYLVAGPGSRRIEDDEPTNSYEGTWSEARGNYSGGSIRWSATPGSLVRCRYSAGAEHSLYIGTRRTATAGQITVKIDAASPVLVDLRMPAEDFLVRVPLGVLAGQTNHTITIVHAGSSGSQVYFDFLELARPTSTLPVFEDLPTTSLATDWDTDHSIALAPERTAWLLQTLGFHGRVNHYVGALWFYELQRAGHQFGSGTITFAGAPEFGKTTLVYLGPTPIEHVNLIGDTAVTIATAFALLINAGSTGVWASADGAALTITARAMGVEGNSISISGDTNSAQFTAQTSGITLSGGADGVWVTDLAAMPRLNRAARDWSRSFFRALESYGIDVTAAFSMELQHGNDTLEAGIAQRYPNGDPAWLNTPALQTNFGPESTGFWRQVYCDMAQTMVDAGVRPYLQFGEVQWWYFASQSGMPFYDSHTKNLFQLAYGRPMAVIASQHVDPAAFPDECTFLPTLIGEFTDNIMTFVRQSYPGSLFEVLYPPDVNDTPLNRIVNLPHAHWTPSNLAGFKTENFTYTGDRDLNKASESIQLPMQLGFARSQSSHLVGIGEYTTPWGKEQRLSLGENIESVVLFALDQFCLIGYGLPLDRGARSGQFMG
jgi:hypothetical protein